MKEELTGMIRISNLGFSRMKSSSPVHNCSVSLTLTIKRLRKWQYSTVFGMYSSGWTVIVNVSPRIELKQKSNFNRKNIPI